MMTAVPLEVELSGQIVRPGDTLLILSKVALSEEMAEMIKARVEERIPGLRDVVVIKADGLGVYRPGSATPDVDHLCEVMHNAYEAAAAEAGWETQTASRKPWAEVPYTNKVTMHAAVRALLDELGLGHDEHAG